MIFNFLIIAEYVIFTNDKPIQNIGVLFCYVRCGVLELFMPKYQ